jgi:small subunit ribosomal protein S1
MESDPWQDIENSYKIGDIVKGKVSKITAFGAFVELGNKIDGLVHVSQISDEHVEKVKDVLKVGDEISARVIKIDKAERRIGLSIKAVNKEYTSEDLKAVGEQVTEALRSGDVMVGLEEAFENSGYKQEDSSSNQ